MSSSAAQIDRAIGVLVASAVGDALGAGYEFGSAPYKGWPAMIGGGLGGFAPGEWTDDTAQAMAIAQVAASGLDLCSEAGLDAVAQGFADWYAAGPPDVGIQTSAVLRAAGPHPTAAGMTAAARAEHESSGRSAGNGSLMRTGPVALAYLEPGQEGALVDAAHAVSALTHHDPLAGDGAALWCLMIRHAVLTGELASPETLVHHLRDPERWRAVAAEAESSTPGTFTQNGWVVGAFQAAWSAITHPPVPEQQPGRHLQLALATAIRIGHDTDTVAAIAGALLGARWGGTAVPLGWQRPLHGWPGLANVDLTSLAVRIVEGDRPGTWPQTDRVDYSWHDTSPSYVEHPLVPNLVIGSATALDDLPEDIDAVVSLCRVGTEQVPSGVESVQVRLIDTDGADNSNLDLLVDDAARTTLTLLGEGKRVYLHCVAAQSRTPTVAARIAALRGHDTEEALRAVVDALPAARPQRFLVDALGRLARGLQLDSSVEFGFHSDEDGDLHLHSDEPESDGWVVMTRQNRAGEWTAVSPYPAGFPALNWRFPRNSWFADRGYDVRIIRPGGAVIESWSTFY